MIILYIILVLTIVFSLAAGVSALVLSSRITREEEKSGKRFSD